MRPSRRRRSRRAAAATRAPCACGARPAAPARRRCARRPCAPGPASGSPAWRCAAYSASRSSSSTSMSSASATARRARSTLTAVAAASFRPSVRLAWSWPVAARYCSRAMPWACSCMTKFSARLLQLVVDQRLGRVVVDQLGQGAGGALDAASGGPGRAGTSSIRSADGVAPLLDRVELADVLGHPLVGRARAATSSWTFLTVTVKSAGSSVPAGRGGEVELVAGGGADELLVEVVGDPAPARPRRASPRR